MVKRSEVPLWGLGVLKALLDRVWAVRHEHLEEAVSLARFAVNVARSLDPRRHDEHEAADWQARAWGEVGNVLRAKDDLVEAERAFGIAFEFFIQGAGDLRLKAKLYDFHASYLGNKATVHSGFRGSRYFIRYVRGPRRPPPCWPLAPDQSNLYVLQ